MTRPCRTRYAQFVIDNFLFGQDDRQLGDRRLVPGERHHRLDRRPGARRLPRGQATGSRSRTTSSCRRTSIRSTGRRALRRTQAAGRSRRRRPMTTHQARSRATCSTSTPPPRPTRICAGIRDQVFAPLKRRGRRPRAVGRHRQQRVARRSACARSAPSACIGLFMPEADSSPDSLRARPAASPTGSASDRSSRTSRRFSTAPAAIDAATRPSARSFPNTARATRARSCCRRSAQGAYNIFSIVVRVAGRRAAAKRGCRCDAYLASSPRPTSSSASAR